MVDELISENLEPFLAPPNLSRIDIKSLMGLRDQVDQRLREHRVELQKQLEGTSNNTRFRRFLP
jgi:hypothetical protein